MSTQSSYLSSNDDYFDEIFSFSTEDEAKTKLEALSKALTNTDVEFTYIDKDHWMIAFD